MKNKDSKIWIISGGISEEREVSLRSGKNVFDSAQRSGYKGTKLFDWRDETSIEEIIQAKKNNEIDMAILMCHGNFGEDGCIQGLLDILHIPYSGSSRESSAICMNKTRTKEILSYYSLPILPSYEVSQLLNARLIEKNLIVKPREGGSSIGITKFDTYSDFIDFYNSNKDFQKNSNQYFIEPYIKGTEVTASIVEGISTNDSNSLTLDGLSSLPILELRPKNEFYDYEAKYTSGMTEFILPAEISPSMTDKIHRIALTAYKVLKCKSAARVDFIIGNEINVPYILEVNTLPGMTDTSDLPAQAKEAGISYDELVQVIIESV